MKTVGIAVDNWKLDIFKKHLDRNNFKYTQHKGLTKDTLFLKVECKFISQAEPIVRNANEECANI